MTRYQACRKVGLDPLSSAITVFVHFIQGVPEGYIAILHTVVKYDVSADASKEFMIERNNE